MYFVPFWVKLALGFLITGLVVLVVGVATPYWVDYPNFHAGLFQYCDIFYGCRTYSFSGAAIGAAAAFTIIAILLGVVVIIVLFYYLSTLSRHIHLAGLICTFIDAALVGIGILCYISAYKHNLSWSFALAVIAGVLILLAGIFLVIHRTKGVHVVSSTGPTGGHSRTTRTVTTTVVRA